MDFLRKLAGRSGRVEDPGPSKRGARPAMDYVQNRLTLSLRSMFEKIVPFRPGGMGLLYRGHDVLLDRDVVIKVVRLPAEPGTPGYREAVRRLKREARMAGVLNHPGIVPIYLAGECPPVPGEAEWDNEPLFFFVMRYVDGTPLSRMPSPVSATEVVKILLDISRAIEYAHTPRPPHGVALIHRDIKPANVVLDAATKSAIVLDFGIGYLDGETRLTGLGFVVGTGRYLAPEQFRGDCKPTVGLDIYGIGCLGYFLLTGHDPFDTFHVVDARLHLAKTLWNVDDLRHEAPGAPQDVVDVIARCMDPNPANRYRSATALIHELEALLPQLGIYTFFAALKDGRFDTEWWESIAQGVKYREPAAHPDDFQKVPTVNVFFLHTWLHTLGFRSVEAAVAAIDALKPIAADVLSRVPQRSRPKAIGVDLIRLVLGVHHRITELFPELDIPEDGIALIVRRYLEQREGVNA